MKRRTRVKGRRTCSVGRIPVQLSKVHAMQQQQQQQQQREGRPLMGSQERKGQENEYSIWEKGKEPWNQE